MFFYNRYHFSIVAIDIFIVLDINPFSIVERDLTEKSWMNLFVNHNNLRLNNKKKSINLKKNKKTKLLIYKPNWKKRPK